MQHRQSKIVDLCWESGLTLNCVREIFVLIASAQSEVFPVNMHHEETHGLEIKPLPKNRSQVLSSMIYWET